MAFTLVFSPLMFTVTGRRTDWGRICMLEPFNTEDKPALIQTAIETILLIYTLIFMARIGMFRRRLCPSGKMSCVGQYRRNVVTFRETLGFTLTWIAIAMTNRVAQALLRVVEPRPVTALYIHTVHWASLHLLPFLCLCGYIGVRGIPRLESRPPPHFHVTGPELIKVPKRSPSTDLRAKNVPQNATNMRKSRLLLHFYSYIYLGHNTG